jgi:hypothetical protein
MDDQFLAERIAADRTRLQAVAYRRLYERGTFTFSNHS